MPDPLSAQNLISVLRAHRLLEPAQLQQLASRTPAELGDARKLAGDLLRQGWLTPYQINQIFQGHANDLFLGPYLLLERIGEGGMGQVFKARHTRLERLVSLKLIRKERLADPESVQRFQREAKGVARLSHINVVTIYDADQANGTHFLAMEFVEGIDLGQMVKKSGPLPPEQACSFIRQTALGLQHIHEAGLVHRDIKPTNLLVASRGGIVKILDLGLARWNDPVDNDPKAGLTQAGTLIGTLDYLAPEQALDCRLADIRADIYSLGCTFYFLLTGQLPFPGGSAVQKIACHAQREPVPIEKLRPGMPPGLQDVVSKMMAKRAEARYQTPIEVAWALDPFCGGAGGATSFPQPTTRSESVGPVAPPRDEMTWSVPMDAVDKEIEGQKNLGQSFSVPFSTFAPMEELGLSPTQGTPAASASETPKSRHSASDSEAVNPANWVRIDKTVLGPTAATDNAPAAPPPSQISPAAAQPQTRGNGLVPGLALFFLLLCAGAGTYGYLVLWPQWQQNQANQASPEDSKDLFDKGLALSQKGEYDDAIEAFTKVLTLDAKYPTASRERAVAFNARNNFESARADAGDAIGTDPKDAAAYRERGRALAGLKTFDQAQTDFTEALRLNPDDGLTYTYRGDAFFLQGDWDKAIADYGAALKNASSPAPLYQRRGQAQVRKGTLDEADADFNLALKADAKFAPALCGLGDVLVIRCDPNPAMLEFNKAMQLDAKSAAAHCGKGDAMNRQGRFREALTEFAKAIALDGKYAPAHAGMAQALAFRNQTPEAIAAAAQAMKLDPRLASAYVWHAVAAAVNPKTFTESMADCNKAVEFAPWWADAYVCRGIVYTRRQEYDKALGEFNTAAKLNPKLNLVHYGRAKLYLAQHKPDQVINECDEAIKTGLKSPGVLKMRGQTFVTKNRLIKAVADYSEAIVLDPDDETAYALRAATYHRVGETEKALTDYSSVLTKDPKRANIHLDCAILLEQKHDLVKALAECDAGIALEPKNLSFYVRKGIIYRAEKEWQKALDEIAKIPKSDLAFVNRGLVYVSKNDQDAAIKEFDEAIRLNPNYAWAYRYRAASYRMKKEYARAIEDWSKAIELEPKEAISYNQRGFEYASEMKFDKAIEDYDRAIELAPNMAVAYRNRAVAGVKSKMEPPKEISADRHIASELDLGVTKAEIDDGFASIFDGHSLKGWKEKEGFSVEKGLLVCPKFEKSKLFRGTLTTDKEYGDFIFRFDFKVEPAARHSVALRGEKFQIVNEHDPFNGTLAPTGSIIGKKNAEEVCTWSAGVWNTQEIMIKGHQWKVTVNGEVVVDIDVSKLAPFKAAAKRTTSALEFVANGSQVEFRHLRVKELK